MQSAEIMCLLGYAADIRLAKTFEHFFNLQYTDGGWRCNKFSYGHGPETECSNPFPTLTALNAFRSTDYLNKEALLDEAVDFWRHWNYSDPKQ
jgi:hypothetical protein